MMHQRGDLTRDSQLMYITQWLNEFSDIEKDDFLQELLDAYAPGQLLIGQRLAPLKLEEKLPTLFDCRIDLFKKWFSSWEAVDRDDLLDRLKETNIDFMKRFEDSKKTPNEDKVIEEFWLRLDNALPQALDITQQNGTINVQENGILNTQENGTMNVQENGISNTQQNGTINVQENGISSVQENGTMNVQENGTMNVQENGTMNVQENGTMNVQENGTMNVQENGTMNVQENGTMNVQENGTMTIETVCIGPNETASVEEISEIDTLQHNASVNLLQLESTAVMTVSSVESIRVDLQSSDLMQNNITSTLDKAVEDENA